MIQGLALTKSKMLKKNWEEDISDLKINNRKSCRLVVLLLLWISSFQMEDNNVKMRLQCFYSAIMASRSRNWTIQIKCCSRCHDWYKYPPYNCDLNEARTVQIYHLKNNSDTIKVKREKNHMQTRLVKHP